MMFVGCGMPRIVVCVLAIALTCESGLALAGTSYQKALAAVAVVRVRLQMAKRAKLGDKKKRNGAGALPVRTDDTADAAVVLEEEIVQAALKPEVDPGFQTQHFERIQFTPDPVGPTLIEDTGIVSATPPEQVIEESPRRAMRFVMDKPAHKQRDASAVDSVSPLPAQLILRKWPSGCPAGEEQLRLINEKLIPRGWKVGTADNSQIKIERGNRLTESCPQLFLMQRGVEIRRWDKLTPVEELSNALRAAWDAGSEQQMKSQFVARGSAGVIHAAAEIRQAMDWMRKYIGDGVPLIIIWDRPADTIGLKAGSDWSYPALLGGRGHVTISARGNVGLPMEGVAFGYAVQGTDLAIEAGTMRLIGILKNRSVSESSLNAGPGPAGIAIIDDIVLVSGVINAFQMIAALLNPTMDLNLPSQTYLTVTLNGDVITADFSRGPTVRIVSLFEFNLLVSKVLVTDEFVNADFKGSDWIKSRRWTVEE